ncbi:MAG: hypothetical protein ACOYOB_12670 [Myxococcota bacterium]
MLRIRLTLAVALVLGLLAPVAVSGDDADAHAVAAAQRRQAREYVAGIQNMWVATVNELRTARAAGKRGTARCLSEACESMRGVYRVAQHALAEMEACPVDDAQFSCGERSYALVSIAYNKAEELQGQAFGCSEPAPDSPRVHALGEARDWETIPDPVEPEEPLERPAETLAVADEHLRYLAFRVAEYDAMVGAMFWNVAWHDQECAQPSQRCACMDAYLPEMGDLADKVALAAEVATSAVRRRDPAEVQRAFTEFDGLLKQLRRVRLLVRDCAASGAGYFYRVTEIYDEVDPSLDFWWLPRRTSPEAWVAPGIRFDGFLGR